MVKCLGIKRLDFVGRDGVEVKGYTLWFCDPMPSSSAWMGVEVFHEFLCDEQVVQMGLDLPSLPGCDVEVVYGRKGRIEAVRPVVR